MEWYNGLWTSLFGAVGVIITSMFIWNFYITEGEELREKKPQRAVYVPPVIDCSKESLIADMEATRNRPIEKLPISVDLPRLARKTIIKDGNKVLLDGTSDSFEFVDGFEDEIRGKLIQNVWSTLSVLVEEEREGVYDNLARELTGGDVALHLANFLRNHYTDHSKVVKILKVCNQSLLAPTVIRMKDRISNDFPYKDQRGQWIITIQKEGEHITVTHCKKEISWEATALYDEQHFEFEWYLRMVFDKEVTRMEDVVVATKAIHFVDSVTEEKRQEIINTFNSAAFMEPFVSNP